MLAQRDFRKIRKFLELSQVQVSLATGIPTSRIGAIERNRVKATALQERLIGNFLEARLRCELGDSLKPEQITA
jgi:hypothetical protein